MEVVAGVAGRLAEQRPRRVLEQPEVAVGVVAFDLVRRRRGAPDESLGKSNAMILLCASARHPSKGAAATGKDTRGSAAHGGDGAPSARK